MTAKKSPAIITPLQHGRKAKSEVPFKMTPPMLPPWIKLLQTTTKLKNLKHFDSNLAPIIGNLIKQQPSAKNTLKIVSSQAALRSCDCSFMLAAYHWTMDKSNMYPKLFHARMGRLHVHWFRMKTVSISAQLPALLLFCNLVLSHAKLYLIEKLVGFLAAITVCQVVDRSRVYSCQQLAY